MIAYFFLVILDRHTFDQDQNMFRRSNAHTEKNSTQYDFDVLVHIAHRNSLFRLLIVKTLAIL